MSFQPRTYQTSISNYGAMVLNKLNIVMLSMEVRTGKTLTAFMICQKAKAKKVLFITKKKVIESETIQNDHKLLNPDFELVLINYESVHKITDKDIDIVIIDESHSLGRFPKPSLRTKRIKQVVGNSRVILMSGTITPESYSQIYHQFWVSNFSPFTETSFYKWAHTYVTLKEIYVAHGNQVNDYSNADIKLIQDKINPYMVTYTQKQAGFESEVEERVLEVEMKPTTYKLIDLLENDLVYEGKNGGVILCDTSVKLMMKVHQLYSGTIKMEDGTAVTIDDSKGQFIKNKFKGRKIGIFYKFKQELVLLKEVFGDSLTTDILEFNKTNKNIALQIISGREGISLRKAEYLVFFNIDFSATSYFQAKDRMTTKERSFNRVYWIFAKRGLEKQIYKTVLNKKSYTTKHYERSKLPIKNN